MNEDKKTGKARKTEYMKKALEVIQQMNAEKSSSEYIRPSMLPGIDLYMDQITTFMDEHLAKTKRYEDDKILTKTMINNYAKNDLLPPPEKKKYSKDHILLLTFIYYYKNILSINDIQTLLAPVKEKYFKNGQPMNLEKIYDEIFDMVRTQLDGVQDDIKNKYQLAGESFADASEGDRDMLSLFAFICLLSYDIYVKKQLVEKIIDRMWQPDEDGASEKDKDKKKK